MREYKNIIEKLPLRAPCHKNKPGSVKKRFKGIYKEYQLRSACTIHADGHGSKLFALCKFSASPRPILFPFGFGGYSN